jgi:hypothetical protein
MKNIKSPQLKLGRQHLLIVGACLLTGCSAMSTYNDDKSDICYLARTQLRETEHYYAKSVAEGAVVGGLIGAGSGAIISAVTGGDVGAGALIGGLSGAFAGGVGGYYNAKQKDIADQQSLAASVRNDILKSNEEIDRTSLAFAKLRDCRFTAAERVKSDFKAGKMPRDKAVKQLDTLRVQFDEDIKIAQELGMKMGQRLTDFQDANNKILDKDPNARAFINEEKRNATQVSTVMPPMAEEEPVISKNRTKKQKIRRTSPVVAAAPVAVKKPATTTAKPVAVEVAHVTEANQIKQKAFVDQIGQAKAQAKAAFSLEGTVSLNEPATLLCGL